MHMALFLAGEQVYVWHFLSSPGAQAHSTLLHFSLYLFLWEKTLNSLTSMHTILPRCDRPWGSNS